MVVRYLTTKVLPAVTVGAAAVTVYCTSAQAFFPPIPTGNSVVETPPPISPITPVSPPPPPTVVPPVSPPPFVPPPVVSPPPVGPQNPDPCRPCDVPEPTTLVTGLVGLSLVGAAALRKKLGKK